MKIAVVVLILCLLTGCKSGDVQLDRAIDLRKSILETESCTFEAVVTADYEDALYTFQMECLTDQSGTLQFTVTDPDTLSGITGSISQESAALTFSDKVLMFPMLADGQLTPVCAPWLFINALRSGYLSGCSNGEAFCIYIDDSFEEQPIQLEIQTDENTLPIHADIIWKGRRILSLDIRNFTLL